MCVIYRPISPQASFLGNFHFIYIFCLKKAMKKVTRSLGLWFWWRCIGICIVFLQDGSYPFVNDAIDQLFQWFSIEFWCFAGYWVWWGPLCCVSQNVWTACIARNGWRLVQDPAPSKATKVIPLHLYCSVESSGLYSSFFTQSDDLDSF